jgi:hypothetical protein
MPKEAMWAPCPDCGEPMEVEWTHNGVMAVLHGVHCGWGQDGFHPDDCFESAKECHDAMLARREAGRD